MSNLALLTNYEINETPMIMDIRTEKVEPYSVNVEDKIYKFRLESTGFLDSNSLLQFKLNKTATAVSNEIRVNSFNGVLGGIKNIEFKIGDQIINSTEDINKIITLTKIANKRRVHLNKKTAWYYGNQFITKISKAGDVSFGQYEMDEDLNGYDYTAGEPNSLNISEVPANNYKYGIRLGELIPALSNIELPLFLFDQYKIYLTIEFHQPSVYCNSSTAITRRCPNTDVQIDDVQLLVDYIIYPASVLNQIRANTEKEGGLILDFLNYFKIQRQLNVLPGTSTEITSNAEYIANGSIQNIVTSQEFRIGMEKLEVHSLTMWKQFQSADNASNKVLLDQRCDGISFEDIQWEINGVPVFQESISSTASQYDQAFMALNYQDLNVERPMFFNDRNSLVAGLATSVSGLQGTYKPQMYDCKTSQVGILGSGTTVGRYPIVCKYKTSPALNLNTYGTANTGNNITLKQDGLYNVDFFVATSRRAIIKNTLKGMIIAVLD